MLSMYFCFINRYNLFKFIFELVIQNMLKQTLQQKLLQKLSPQQIQFIKLLQVPTVSPMHALKKN